MFYWSWKSSVVALLVAGHAFFATRAAHSGPILDWLFGPRPSANQQVVAYYPPAYYPSVTYPSATSYYRAPSPSGYPSSYPSNYPANYPASYPANYTGNYASGSTMTYRAPAPAATYQTYQTLSPTVAYYGSSACQSGACGQVSSSACCAPTVAYQSPEIMCGPAPVACPPQPPSRWCLGSCLGRGQPPATVTPVRQSFYRTSWKRVPVTSYRPVTSADPVTGCPVTVMKACTTYSWQPDRRRCGFFGRLFGRCDPGPAAVACPPDPCMTQCVPTPSCCGPMAPTMVPSTAAPTPAAAPYYAPGAGAPTVPSSVLPPTGVSSPSLAPGGMAPGAPTTGEPADTQPSLVPGEAGSGISAPLQGSLQGSTSSQWDSSVPSVASPRDAIAGPNIAGPQQAASTPMSLGKPVPLPPRGAPAAADGLPQFNPVPDPDAAPVETPSNQDSPQLLAPRDRVASLRSQQAWSYTTISWPQPSRAVRAPTDRQVAPASPRLDDSGWYSVAQ